MLDLTQTQGDLDWHRARLGNFTGSRISDLIGKPRSKDAEWTDTALTYINEVEGQRTMNEMYIADDDLFKEYLALHSASSKYLDWGSAQEEFARDEYTKQTGNIVQHKGSVAHPTLEYFASSPDGVVPEGNGCIEIKCPKMETFVKYRNQIHDNDSLLKVVKNYAYQIQAHMMCTGAEWCDFVAYCVFQAQPLHVVRIYPDADMQAQIADAVTRANARIDTNIQNLNNNGK